jgi:tRNA 2-thiouridine synthesizing protein A
MEFTAVSEPATPDEQLADLRGLKCPEPLMMVRKSVRAMRGGELLHVVASDPTTLRDIPQFCRFLEHELLAQWQEGDDLHFRLRKSHRGQ